jgi:hypothetical protein
MAKPSRQLSEHECAERRRQDRERLQRAAHELLSSDGWARWVLTRAMFHNYSARPVGIACPELGSDLPAEGL